MDCMLSFGVNTIEPNAPQGEIVPSFCSSKSESAGIAPNPPEYPFGPTHAVNPHEFSLKVLNEAEININGLVKVKGSIECESITIKGSIQCDGILKAQSVNIYPYSKSYCNEIKSSKIEILKYRRKYIPNLYKVKHGRFSCKSMKGDDIKLENSYVEYIEYTKNLNISDDCKVEKSVKVS